MVPVRASLPVQPKPDKTFRTDGTYAELANRGPVEKSKVTLLHGIEWQYFP